MAKKDEKYFYDQVQRFELVDYKGVLNPKNINFVLSEYDALVLLTRYEGEGFPGSILDAYISGIPVLVTDWLFLPEFVDEGETGFVVKDVDLFIEKVKLLANDKVLLKAMKQNAVAKSQEFSAEKAWSKIEGFFPEQDRCVVSK